LTIVETLLIVRTIGSDEADPQHLLSGGRNSTIKIRGLPILADTSADTSLTEERVYPCNRC